MESRFGFINFDTNNRTVDYGTVMIYKFGSMKFVLDFVYF